MIRLCLLGGSVIYFVLFGLHMVMDVNPYVHIIMNSLGMGAASVSIYMQWGLVGEAIDYNEYVTGKRTEGSIYGTFNLSRRIGQTIGLGVSFFALDWIGYNPSLDAQGAATIFGFKTLCVLTPAVFVLGSWAAFKFVWNITPAIREKMNVKKAGILLNEDPEI